MKRPESQTLQISRIGTHKRTQNRNHYLECETDAGVAAFWGRENNLNNIHRIEQSRAPLTVKCGCISPRRSDHDIWVPESSSIEIIATASPAPPAEIPSSKAHSSEAPSDNGWDGAIKLAAPEMQDLLEKLFKREASVPEVGFELSEDTGRVLAEAELAWPGHKVAVLLADRDEDFAAFEAAGWRVFTETMPNLAEALANALAGED